MIKKKGYICERDGWDQGMYDWLWHHADRTLPDRPRNEFEFFWDFYCGLVTLIMEDQGA